MEMWTKVRRSVLAGKWSKRQTCKKYGNTSEDPGPLGATQEATARRTGETDHRPLLADHPCDPKVGQGGPKKQRHTGKRVFERLRDEVAVSTSTHPRATCTVSTTFAGLCHVERPDALIGRLATPDEA